MYAYQPIKYHNQHIPIMMYWMIETQYTVVDVFIAKVKTNISRENAYCIGQQIV